MSDYNYIYFVILLFVYIFFIYSFYNIYNFLKMEGDSSLLSFKSIHADNLIWTSS
jgi:hypothetical protein